MRGVFGVVAGLSAALVACGGATCPTRYTPPAGEARPFLYVVDETMVLFGTWHGAGEDDVPAAAWAAVDEAERFVAEVDDPTRNESSHARERVAKTLTLPRGQSLPDLLDDGDWYDLLTITGMPAERLQKLKPWVVMGMLTRKAVEPPSPSMDEALEDRARDAEIEVEYLETWDEQVAALDQSVGAPALAEAIHAFPTMKCTLADARAAYLAGDDARMGGSLDDDERDALIVERNARWLPKLEQHLASGRKVFVAVGVGHLVGPGGLVNALEAAGHTVRRAGAAAE